MPMVLIPCGMIWIEMIRYYVIGIEQSQTKKDKWTHFRKRGGGMSHKFVINTWTITNSSNKEANQKSRNDNCETKKLIDEEMAETPTNNIWEWKQLLFNLSLTRMIA